MGMVHAHKKGELKDPPAKVKKAAKSMSKKQTKKYASTKHKGLPSKIKEDIKNSIKEAIKKEMSSVAGIAGYHGGHVDQKKGIYKSDVESDEKRRPRKKGKKMIGKGPQGDKHFSKVESTKTIGEQADNLNETIKGAVVMDILNTDMTPECKDNIMQLEKDLSTLQVDINSSFQHAQEFLKLGQKTHRKIEFERLAVEAKRLENLVTQYKNKAMQIMALAGDVNNRVGMMDWMEKMSQHGFDVTMEE